MTSSEAAVALVCLPDLSHLLLLQLLVQAPSLPTVTPPLSVASLPPLRLVQAEDLRMIRSSIVDYDPHRYTFTIYT